LLGLNRLASSFVSAKGWRALLPLCKSAGLRLALGGLVNTFPRVWPVLVLYLTVTTLWALVGMEYLHM
jgi:hypothetical protein